MWNVNAENYRKLIAVIGSIFVIAMATYRLVDETNTQANSKKCERVLESAVILLVMFIGVIVAGPGSRWRNNIDAVNTPSKKKLNRVIDSVMIVQLVVVLIICVTDVWNLIHDEKYDGDASVIFGMANDTNDDFHVIFKEDNTNLNLIEFAERNKVRSKYGI